MKNILKIIRLSKPLYGLIATITFLILVGALLELVSPVLSKLVVDEIVLQLEQGSGTLDRLYMFIGLTFVASIASVIISSLTQRLGDHFAGKLRKFLTEVFYDKVLTLPQSYFDGEISGKIINQLNRGITTIQEFINASTNFILPSILQSILTIVLLAYYNIYIAFFISLVFPIYIYLSYKSSIKWGKEEVKKNKIEDINKGRMTEVISNIKLVKSFTNELSEYKILSKNLKNINEIYANQSNTFHLYDFLRNFGLNIILLGINVIVFYNTFERNLTIGEMVLIIQLVNQARRPLFAMSFILGQVQHAESGSKEFFEILGLESVENYKSYGKVQKIKNPSIKLEDIEFSYDKSENVLQKINFSLEQNDIVALVGPSGAGKSTLINLIMKFYNPTSGKIILDGKSYEELSHNFVRENISLVFQENELFSTTIKENVSYGQKATDEEIITALKKANAWEFVSKLKDGINQQIGERGIKLSGGQRQRIQIARAILKNAPILILDEATSNLDAKSENEVQDALETLMKGKLSIIIAHRFSTIQNATKVIVLNNKSVEDIGSPQSLAKKHGIYAELLNYQIEGNKKLLKKFDIVG